MNSSYLQPEWFEIESSDEAASNMMAEISRLETMLYEEHYEGLVYQQYASARRLPNIYGISSAKGIVNPMQNMNSFAVHGDNQIAIGVETLVAGYGSAKPWVQFSTTDGDFTTRTTATRKGDFFYGLLHDIGFYAQLPEFVRDQLVWGWAVAKVVAKGKGKKVKLDVEKCLPSEVLWDRANNLLTQPRARYHHRYVLREALAKKYPEHEDAIFAAAGASNTIPGLSMDLPGSFVQLGQGWAPSIDGIEPGRHMIAVGNTCLVDEKMKPEEEDPFVFLTGYSVGHGWQYQGIVEQLLPDQILLSKQNALIAENQRRGSVSKWMVAEGSGVQDAALSNRAAQIVRYKGTRPEQVVFPTTPPELYQDRDATRQRILQRCGVNGLQSQGLVPTQLKSGEAVREYGQHAAQRHTTLSDSRDNFVVGVVQKLIPLAAKHNVTVKAPGKRSVQKIKWETIALPEDSYKVEIAFPIGGRTPAELVDLGNELLQMQEIDKVTYSRLTQNPDLAAAINPTKALADAIECILDGIVEDGAYQAPDDGLDLPTAFAMVNARRWRCIADKAPQEIIDMLSDWRDEIQALQQKATQPAPPPATPPGTPTVAPTDVLPGPAPVQFPPN